jgi:beta-lactamase class A
MKTFGRYIFGFAALAGALLAPATAAAADNLETSFDSALGTQVQPQQSNADYLYTLVASVARNDRGRIGVAAMDLATGRTVSVGGDQPFPLASTSKIAIAATYLDGVDRGIYRLSDMYPLMVPLPSKKFDGPIAPVRPGARAHAERMIELALIRSDNQATDALLAAVGGPQAVNAWLRRSGITGMRIDRDIATLVRDDGAIDPAKEIDTRDAGTPQAMIELLHGIHQGTWLSPASNRFLLATMERCITGKRRIPAMLPQGSRIAHKTGTLNNTASDVGIVHLPDGRAVALAIYVTGQGGKPNRDARIATIARTIYDGYLADRSAMRLTASR